MDGNPTVKANWHGFKLWWVVRDGNDSFIDEFPTWAEAIRVAQRIADAPKVITVSRQELLDQREEILLKLEDRNADLWMRLTEVDYLLGWPPEA